MKKTILILGLILIGILLIGCIEQPNLTEEVANCQSLPSDLSIEMNQNNCLTYLATDLKNPQICELIEEPKDNNEFKQLEIDWCYSQVAPAQKESKTCNLISDQYYKDICYSQIAHSTKNVNLCNLISTQDEKDLCYSELAFINNDVNLCNEIEDQSREQLCIYNIDYFQDE
jgi:hypothetical protein